MPAPLAFRDAAQAAKGQAQAIAVYEQIQCLGAPGLAVFSVPAALKSSHDVRHRAPVFSLPIRKILATKLLQFDRETL